ncbi:MAG: GatB/YqeY domain-containing protein [Deltaproteobacteria bacterium]|nr:GatB/YqeY domain-containing protein [Deltaproteobacteria bacterium]
MFNFDRSLLHLQETISELSADSPRDLGKVMKAAMARIAGKAQGKEVNEIARKLLS